MEKRQLPQEELEKIAADDYSAYAFATKLENEGLIKAPGNLKESILLQSQSPLASAEQTLYKTSKKLELIYYSLKVSFAVLSALFFLFAGGLVQDLAQPSVPSPQPTEATWAQRLSEHSYHAGEKLKTFSENLFALEVFDYDK